MFITVRLAVRKAAPTKEDIEFFHRLWNHPRVMSNVGFPHGLQITPEKIRELFAQPPPNDLNSRLIVTVKETGEKIGECKLGAPDENGLSETDVKLLPEYWGKGYGTEIKRALLRCLFAWTDCRIVQATPNVNNPASIRMQEAVGGKRIEQGEFRFPDNMAAFTTPVKHYIYHVYRDEWVQRNTLAVSPVDTSAEIRLRPVAYRDAETALPWYQDMEVLFYMDGPQRTQPYTLELVHSMYRTLSAAGEFYQIDLRVNDDWLPIGDAALSDETLPIAIGRKEYWGCGIGSRVLQRLIQRACELGYRELRVKEILDTNPRSLNLYRSAGFREIRRTDNGIQVALGLTPSIDQSQ